MNNADTIRRCGARAKRAGRSLGMFVLISLAACRAPAAYPAENAAHVLHGPRPVRGWPVILGNKIFSTAAVADVNGDGRDEVVVSIRDGRVYLIDGEGRISSGWPRSTANMILYSPLLTDIGGDGDFEIFAASGDGFMYAWNENGDRLPSWPVDLEAPPTSAPRLIHLEPGGDPSILVASQDGNIHLLDPEGGYRRGWPRSGAIEAVQPRIRSPVESLDIDGDKQPEILFLSHKDAILSAWRADGSPYPGFPRELGGYGVGIAVDGRYEKKLIAAVTQNMLFVLDAEGKIFLRCTLPSDGDEFSSAPAFIIPRGAPGHRNALVAAATKNGSVHIWNMDGKPIPGWPVHLGGFIYGVTEPEETFEIIASPRAWDVDGDGEIEILVGSADQHLYCFELDGELLPGWPLILDDDIRAAPCFAQLDGTGPLEMLVSQAGEALFAFHLGPHDRERISREQPDAGLYGPGEWPRSYFIIAACIILMLLLLIYRLRQESAAVESPPRPAAAEKIILALVIALILARVFVLAGELRRYVEFKQRLRSIDPTIERILSDTRKQIQDTAVLVAASLERRGAFSGGNPFRLLYHMEQLADHHRLDYAHTGMMVTDTSGTVMQALGLASGLTHFDHEEIDASGGTAPHIFGSVPAYIGHAVVPSQRGPVHFYFVSGFLSNLPQDISDGTGASVHIRLDGRTLAWAGTPSSARHVWPWLGITEAARDISLPTVHSGARLSLHLSLEGHASPYSPWIDLAIVLLLPVLYSIISIRRGIADDLKLSWWWILGLIALFSAGLFAFSRFDLTTRQIPYAGHVLEFLLYLLGFFGLATIFRILIGKHRGRRLNFALAVSYLIVGLLPLALFMIIAANLLQQAQRRTIAETMTDLEERADHLVMAYIGSYRFIGDIRKSAAHLLEKPAELGWLDFVGEDQYLFTYDLPSAYLTLRVHDRSDPDRHFTGYSWGAPRTAKFFSALPAWTGGEQIKGLFLDSGHTIIRSARTLRTRELEAQLTGHIPIDEAILRDLEDRLRILPFLPRIDLQPAWIQAPSDPDRRPGWRLPFDTKLILPVRDWKTGTPRWIEYRANAYLPVGRERWTVLFTTILIILMPLALSVWGVYSTFQRTVRPLNRLLTGIQRLETGDLDYHLGDTGSSEIAAAARAFDRMADSLKRTVRELAEKQKVEEISELKSRFISMVSHDLKTPLSAIKGATENLLSKLAGPLTDQQRNYLEMILASSKNLQQMIADLLDLSHIESGHLVLDYEVLDIKREAENVLRSVQPLLDERQLRARIDATARETTLPADRTRLWQIFNNILSNAIRFSPSGGLIVTSIEDDAPPEDGGDAFLRVTITDEGTGFPDGADHQLFEPFYAVPAGPEGTHGAGLGLAIVKHLVELHGGTVSLSNSEHGGARFSFTLPWHQQS